MSKWYAATGITGSDQALDMVPDPGDYTDLQTGDKCFEFHSGLYTRIYEYDEALVATENIFGTEVIPDDNVSGTGAWKEKRTTGLMSFWAGTVANEINATVSEAGGVVSLDFECTGTIPGVGIWSDDIIPIPIQSIVLAPGDDDAPTAHYVHVLKADPGTLVTDTQWPATEHVKIAYCLIPSAAYVAAEGAYINQNWNDGNETNGMGHLSSITENIRLTQDGGHWHSGVAGNGATDNYITIVTDDTPDSAYFLSTAGVCFQMHRHTVPAYNSQSNGGMLCVNSDAGAYTPRIDIRDEEVDALGGSLTNKYYNIVFWMVANKSGEHEPVMMNMPTGSYVGLSSAINDVDGYDVYDIPRQFKEDSATGFLVCRITFRQTASAITVHNTTDLRGRTPGTASGTSLVAGTEFADNQFKVYAVGDITKIVDLDLTGITTGNTRTIEIPDHDMIIPGGTLAGATELYYAGVKQLETGAEGVIISTSGFDGLLIRTNAADDVYLDSLTNSGNFYLRGKNTADTVLNTLFLGDPDGAVELYFAGTKQLETNTNGITIFRDVTKYGDFDFSSGGQLNIGNNSIGQPLVLFARNDADTVSNSLFLGDPDGAVELYFAGVKAIETSAAGVAIHSGSDRLDISKNASGWDLYSYVHGLPIRLRGENDSGDAQVIFSGDPDGSAELYYAGTKTFETRNDGVKMWNDAATAAGFVYFSGTTFRLYNSHHGSNVQIMAEDAAGGSQFLFIGDPDGAVELYYGGVKAFATTAETNGGIIVYGASTQNVVHKFSGADHYITNTTDSGIMYIRGTNVGSAVKNLLVGDPDGAAELYHAGVKVFETKSSGFFAGDGTNVMYLAQEGSRLTIESLVHGSEVALKAENTATGASKHLFIGDPDGAAELYYAGVKKVETTETGILATGINTSASNEFTWQQGFDEGGLTSAGTTAWDLSRKQVARLTLAHNVTMDTPTNMQQGSTYVLRVVQAAGIFTLAWDAVFKWGAASVPVAPAANGDVVIFSFYCDGTNLYGVEMNRTEA